MRRALAAFALAGLAALVIGSAASLDVLGGAIQAGSDTNLVCDDAVQVAGWGLETDDGKVYFVRVGDIAEDCNGNTLFVSVTQNGSEIAKGSVEISNGGGTGIEKVGLNKAVDAVDITDIEVFIEGPSGS